MKDHYKWFSNQKYLTILKMDHDPKGSNIIAHSRKDDYEPEWFVMHWPSEHTEK
jgi:hypothetical protein